VEIIGRSKFSSGLCCVRYFVKLELSEAFAPDWKSIANIVKPKIASGMKNIDPNFAGSYFFMDSVSIADITCEEKFLLGERGGIACNKLSVSLNA